MNQTTLTQEIKTEARQMGFQLVGITSPDPPAHLESYNQWLKNGYHAGMAWMATDRARQRRANPLIILPDCKSILVLGIRYPQPASPKDTQQTFSGRVASYAWGQDYHDVLPARLRQIVSFIQERVGKEIPNRWYTDTGPILERELAQRAGLGWIGKNSCLINPRSGSYFLLAEIFLGIELVFDSPVKADYCGSCTRCILQCPTGCITADRTIDANRCISYLTIEHKGSIPISLRPKIGNWVFGCDICQIACPWNKKFSDTEFEAAFSAHPEFPPHHLMDELALSPQQFNQKFKNSPIKRAKRRGYLRNVAVALGNTGDSEAIPALSQALQDPESMVRSHAAWSLGQIGGENAKLALKKALQSESNNEVREEVSNALNGIISP